MYQKFQFQESVSSSNIVQSGGEHVDGISSQNRPVHEKVETSNYPPVFDVKNGSIGIHHDVTGDNIIQVADIETDDRRRTTTRVFNKHQG